jgi:hypothetical protein
VERLLVIEMVFVGDTVGELEREEVGDREGVVVVQGLAESVGEVEAHWVGEDDRNGEEVLDREPLKEGV